MSRSKRGRIAIVTLVCLLLCSCLIVGCGNGNENKNPPAHTEHNWSDTYTEDDDGHYQTCDGCDERKYGEHSYNAIGYCICGKAKPETPPENPPAHTEHNWSDTYTEDDDGHYQTCDGCDERKYGEHSYVDGICVCGKEYYTKGLLFGFNDDRESYEVWTFAEDIFDIDVVIPSRFMGKPVTGISKSAFKDKSNVRSIKIPDSIISIGNEAFRGCNRLMSISIPDSITSIGDSAFYGCSSLTSITLPSVTSIGDHAFYGCNRLMSISIPDRESISDLHPTNSY